jgi:hypothetical protein
MTEMPLQLAEAISCYCLRCFSNTMQICLFSRFVVLGAANSKYSHIFIIVSICNITKIINQIIPRLKFIHYGS